MDQDENWGVRIKLIITPFTYQELALGCALAILEQKTY